MKYFTVKIINTIKHHGLFTTATPAPIPSRVPGRECILNKYLLI